MSTPSEWLRKTGRVFSRARGPGAPAEDPEPLWILPKTRAAAIHRARVRADSARWDIDVAVFLFAVLIIIIILIFSGFNYLVTAPVSILGLFLVWLVGRRKANRAYASYLPQELRRYPDEWKDYYGILHVSPEATPEEITEGFHNLSAAIEGIRAESEQEQLELRHIKNNAAEARQVLTDPALKAGYDYFYWRSANAASYLESDVRNELLGLSQEIYTVTQKRAQSRLRSVPLLNRLVPFLDRVPARPASAVLGLLLAIGIAGTALALSNPEHALAVPFRGPAIVVARTSVGIMDIIEMSREAAAGQERAIISTALQAMRLDKSVTKVPPVTSPTNDMASFPSIEHALYPDYIESRFSQFRYTVTGGGLVSVDSSWATTDKFLNFMLDAIDRLEKSN